MHAAELSGFCRLTKEKSTELNMLDDEQEDDKKLFRRWDTRMWRRSILIPLLCLTPPMEGFPWEDLHKILYASQLMTKVQNGKEILQKVLAPLAGCMSVTW